MLLPRGDFGNDADALGVLDSRGSHRMARESGVLCREGVRILGSATINSLMSFSRKNDWPNFLSSVEACCGLLAQTVGAFGQSNPEQVTNYDGIACTAAPQS